MKYDVFISYSRKDNAVAESLCKALDKEGVDYWIDRNIHGSANFLSEITRYIRDCKVVLFIASSNSATSTWTQKEILYALKYNKHIVPYRIGNFSFDDNAELDFVFMNVQWIESESAVISTLNELGCCNKSKGGTIALEALQVSSATKTYKVGDYYNDGTKEGVVFDVWDGGRHGKIVSLEQNKLSWCTREQFDKGIDVRTRHFDDGEMRTNMVMRRGDRAEYPAFVWCRNLGKGWYLPMLEELRLLLLDDSVHDAVNRTLGNRGETRLFNKGEKERYWSSEEFTVTTARAINIEGVFDNRVNRYRFNSYLNRYALNNVRAVAQF